MRSGLLSCFSTPQQEKASSCVIELAALNIWTCRSGFRSASKRRASACTRSVAKRTKQTHWQVPKVSRTGLSFESTVVKFLFFYSASRSKRPAADPTKGGGHVHFFKRRRGEGVRIYHPLKLTSCLHVPRRGARSASCDRRQREPVRVGKLQGRQANVTVSPRSLARCFHSVYTGSVVFVLLLVGCSLRVCRTGLVRCAPH